MAEELLETCPVNVVLQGEIRSSWLCRQPEERTVSQIGYAEVSIFIVVLFSFGCIVLQVVWFQLLEMSVSLLFVCVYVFIVVCHFVCSLPSTRQHPSYGDCLEVKREYYQNCSVLDCATQCSQSAEHLHKQFLQVQQIGIVTLGPLCRVYRQLSRVVLL